MNAIDHNERPFEYLEICYHCGHTELGDGYGGSDCPDCLCEDDSIHPMKTRQLTADDWSEYDAVAHWCAKRGLRGVFADPLPPNTSAIVLGMINAAEDDFIARVTEMAQSDLAKRV